MIDLPDTMRVARLYRWGDVRVETVPVPRPGRGEALIRIEACGLCGSDVLEWYVNRKAPIVLGHEPAGVVVDVGDGVDGLVPGDRVFVHHHAPCGDCPECERGLWSNCAVWRASRLEPGGFAEFVLAPAVIVTADTLRLPDHVDFDTATFVEPVACCLRALRRGALQPGDSLHIIGLGAMGLVMTRLGRIMGAGSVTGSDYVAERRELALRFGADAAFDPAAVDSVSAVRDRTDGRGAEVVIVCPGDQRAVNAGLSVAAPGARVVCFTPQPPDVPLTIDQSDLYFRELTLTQSYSCGPDETRQSLAWLADGSLDPGPLVTDVAGLDGVADALERTRAKSGIKTIIRPGR
jgi:L-iditol 2-dehydrogenase